jgi:mannose-1-phosphate guanylyltransferase
MKALLLAAGRGARLRPASDKLPKCLMPIRGVPLIDYWLASLKYAGINSILINLHYKADMVRRHIQGRSVAMDISMVYERELLNTGGTLLNNRKFFNGGRIMLIHADNLCLADLSRFIEAHEHRPDDAIITMMTYVTDTPKSCGIVLTDERGMVREFHEKVARPPGNTANAAVYILEPEIMEFLESLGKTAIDFSTEVLPAYIGRIYTYHNDIYHRDIGTVDALEKVQHFKPVSLNWLPENIDSNYSLYGTIDELSLKLNKE